MKRQLLFIIAILSFVVIASGCTQQQQQQKNTKIAELGKDFTLKQGETAFFKSENLRVKFVNITEDSRCPSEVNLALRAGHVDDAFRDFNAFSNHYILRILEVNPYPESAEIIKQSDYSAKFILYSGGGEE